MKTIIVTAWVETTIEVIVEVEDNIFATIKNETSTEDDVDNAISVVEDGVIEAINKLNGILPQPIEYNELSSAKTFGGEFVFEI